MGEAVEGAAQGVALAGAAVVAGVGDKLGGVLPVRLGAGDQPAVLGGEGGRVGADATDVASAAGAGV